MVPVLTHFTNQTLLAPVLTNPTVANGVLLLTPYGAASNVKHLEHLKTVKGTVEVISTGIGFSEAKLKDELGKEFINVMLQRALGKKMTEKVGDTISDKTNIVLDEVGVYDQILAPIPQDTLNIGE